LTGLQAAEGRPASTPGGGFAIFVASMGDMDMSRAVRTIVVLALIELFLVGLWLYLARLAATSPGTSPDAARVIGRTMGGAIGLVLGLSPALYLLARRNDRKAIAKKHE
jgi:hypothetical protein